MTSLRRFLKHLRPRWPWTRQLCRIETAVGNLLAIGRWIVATQQELTDKLAAVASTLDKVGGETSQLVNEVQTLKDLLAAGPALSPELVAAVDAVASRAAAIDALVPDAPQG